MERFVYVQQEEAFEKRNVNVGVSDFFHAEIQEGLKPGEVVALELPKEEREKKARELASQKKSPGETASLGARPGGPASGTRTNVGPASGGASAGAATAGKSATTGSSSTGASGASR